MKKALISVYDKTDILEVGKRIKSLGYEIISSGGTHNFFKKNDIDSTEIFEITKFPECLGGRIKTLHPKIYGGLLAKRSDPDHITQIEELGIEKIDILIVNLYPFKETLARENATDNEIIENIDIGGPSMIRASAKNFEDVLVLVDPEDYSWVLAELESEKKVSRETRITLAKKAFELTAHYDTIIQGYFKSLLGSKKFEKTFTTTYEKAEDLRYGENPHQLAALYKEANSPKNCLVNAKKLHGKELSYNNISDSNSALELLKEFDEAACVVVKHASPCGVGIGKTAYEAYMNAYDADPVSIFGGVITLNCEVDAKVASEINKIFVEIVIAPSFSKEALQILCKKTNVRLLELENFSSKNQSYSFETKKISGGILVQEEDKKTLNRSDIKCVTKKFPTESELKALTFAWKVVKHVKSNAIVLANRKQTVGICGGQPNRITALEVAIKNAKGKVKNSVMASDAFFPFPDCVKLAHENQISSIIQPGGSIRDLDSIKMCDEHSISMVFTGFRHFKH